MFTVRPRTVRQYTGSGTAAESNARYRQLVARGTTELPVVFDLPTQRGHDSDDPTGHGQVGRAGVAVDSLDDMRVLFAGIPLDRVSTSMAVNAPAGVLLLLYQLAAEEQGARPEGLAGAVHNDVLTEYVARGRWIFPPRPSLRLAADVFTYCRAQLPQWNPLSISGVSMAEAGASPAQEIAFTLAGGFEYVRAAVACGMDVDDFASRLSFSFAPRGTVREEVATLRAAHRIWARVLSERFGARSPAPWMPVRRAVRGLATVLGRTRSQEPDVTTGAASAAVGRAVTRRTDDVEAAAMELIGQVEDLGGAVAAVEQGFQRDAIARNAHRHRPDADEPYELAYPGRAIEQHQAERLAKLRAWRSADRVDDALVAVRKAAGGSDNVLYPMKQALASGATVGEVCDALRQVWGTYETGVVASAAASAGAL